jgi:16S rRNA (cytosine1402-N4)-methyltransferase
MAILAPKDGAIIVDGTFGAGGYAQAALKTSRCTVYAIDRDPRAVAAGQALAALYPNRLFIRCGRFGEMGRVLAEDSIDAIDGVALDLGVSSMQIDNPERGFSFRADGPLDMRMESDGADAADAVNTMAEAELADILWRFGEERHARKLTRAIIAQRKIEPFATTGQLADLVRRVVPKSKDGIDPATRTFQALRIYVNDELGQVNAGLVEAERLLKPGGRLAVVSFHSLEDRIVKEFLKHRSGAMPHPSRHMPDEHVRAEPSFRLLTRRPTSPSAEEIAANPRARSARLRAAERTFAPAQQDMP